MLGMLLTPMAKITVNHQVGVAVVQAATMILLQQYDAQFPDLPLSEETLLPHEASQRIENVIGVHIHTLQEPHGKTLEVGVPQASCIKLPRTMLNCLTLYMVGNYEPQIHRVS